MKNDQSGFILLLVIGVLTALFSLAVVLTRSASKFQQLTSLNLQKTKSNMLARSGFRHALTYLAQNSSQFVTGKVGAGKTTKLDAISTSSFEIYDKSGRIDINDGILAGKMEHEFAPISGGYQANAIDPWPDASNAPDGNPSGLINLRLRRLLNAYGDAHIFISKIGMPVHERGAFSADPKKYGEPMKFSSTDAMPKYSSIPGRDKDGNDLNDLSQIANKSTGLGDRIIASRPRGGYHSVVDVEKIVNLWSSDLKFPASYLNGNTFFEMIERDICVDAYSDRKTHRMVRELGQRARSESR